MSNKTGKSIMERVFGEGNATMFKIAFRNVFRQKRRSFITSLAMIGGFMLASLSLGFITGTFGGMVEQFTRNNLGHIQVHSRGYFDKPTLYNTIGDYGKLAEKIVSEKVIESWAPRLYSGGLVSVGEKTAGASIIGIDPKLENEALNFDSKIEDGRGLPETASHKALLGKGFAKILSASVGDSIIIVSQAADGSIANDIYEINGIISSGNDMADRATLYLDIQDAQELFVLENQAHELVFIVDNIDHVSKDTDKIRAEIDTTKYSVMPWQEFAKSFYEMVQAKLSGNYITNIIIALIVGIGVLNTVLMSVLERTREYGVLKAIGTKPIQIFKLIFFETLLLASASIILGAILGVGLNFYFSLHGISYGTEFEISGFVLDKASAKITAQTLYLPALIVFCTAMIVSIFPAIFAARTKPAKTMRM